MRIRRSAEGESERLGSRFRLSPEFFPSPKKASISSGVLARHFSTFRQTAISHGDLC
jgi:hypothetical protein